MASAELSKESQAVLAVGELDLSLPLDEIRALADRHDPEVRGKFVYPGTSEERNVPSVLPLLNPSNIVLNAFICEHPFYAVVGTGKFFVIEKQMDLLVAGLT